MQRLAVLLAMVSFLSLGATSTLQCNIPDITVVVPPIKVVTVQYVNSADADVTVSLLYMTEDDKDKGDLQDDGKQIDTLVAKGQTQQVVLDCDRAGSLAVDRAKLLVVGDIGPTDGTDAFHIGHDYECGGTISFTYYNSPDLTELHTQVDTY